MLDARQRVLLGQRLKQSRLEPLFRVVRTIGPGGEVSRATYFQVACDAGCNRHRRVADESLGSVATNGVRCEAD